MDNKSCIVWAQLRSTYYPLLPRYGHSAAAFFNGTTDLVYVYGGRGENASAFGDVFLFDPLSSSCNFELTDGATPAARSFQSATIAGHRYVVFGGLTSAAEVSGANEYSATTNSFYLLDILRRPMNWADRMQVLERAPVFRKSTLWPPGWGCGIVPIQKQAVTLTKRGQQILYFGGDIGNSMYSRCVFSYDFPQSTWSLLYPQSPGTTCAESGVAITGASAPAGRAAAAAAPFSGHDAVYYGGSRAIVNGSNVSIMFFDDLWLFSVASQSWRTVPTLETGDARPAPRDGHSLTVAPSWLSESSGWLLYGGRSCPGNQSSCNPQDLVMLNDLWLLRIEGNGVARWSRLRECGSLSGATEPLARSFHTMTLVNDEKLILIGGVGDESIFGDVWSLQWKARPPDAPARPVQSLPLETRRVVYIYVLFYFPKLSWYAPEQFTVAIDESLKQGLQRILVNAYVEALDIELFDATSGGGGHGKVLARGTLAQYAVLVGSAFARKLILTTQDQEVPRYLSAQTGTSVEVLAYAAGQPLPMTFSSVESGQGSQGGSGLSTSIIATIATISSAAAAAFLLGIAILLYRWRWRRRRIQRMRMSSVTPGRIEHGRVNTS
ncbi:hypothetical protein CCYA_CCYA19G4705 [Cyanidiococcus yangmingshanensis]|uniref:Uncharacterized protein n=1 Tax=Cyanidiococcus yangmingshanensis TaxID=2690220 RepID=A0A7J7IBQ6_9RHOD|nr:hypothetical protein F1559_001034 [Cyanidiococcus yangmingshanensis]KAK4533823.1 hypothetical protein CCYA_CCYA19G4705 [Cyanidiococcus yangmingshanensis]